MEFAYFPGCSGDATGVAYTKSLEFVNERIGLQLREMEDWNCCGTSAARVESEDLMHALPARSLALSEQQLPGLDVVAPCTGCYSALKGAQVWAAASEENRAHVSELIGSTYEAKAQVRSYLEVMCQPEMLPLIQEQLTHTLGGMKLACYYGCMQVRPAAVCEFGTPEGSDALEALMNAAGAKCVDWDFKCECCGASNHIIAPGAARAALEKILRNAEANGAEAIVTSCPLCLLNLDMRQAQINREQGTNYHFPVYYFSQLLALAMGANAEEVGFKHHFTNPGPYAAEHLEALPKPQAGEEASDE